MCGQDNAVCRRYRRRPIPPKPCYTAGRVTCSARSLGSAACTTSSLSAGSVRSHSHSSSSSSSLALARPGASTVEPKERALAASSLACRSRSVRPLPTVGSGCMPASCAVSALESRFMCGEPARARRDAAKTATMFA
eukprot:scaffold63162_cov48-Phaeocystis_antarctica.AAC.2